MNYDVVVVGAGSAGATLASLVSEDSARTVLVLEAGPDYVNLDLIPDGIKFGGMRTTPDAPPPSGIVPGTRWNFAAKMGAYDDHQRFAPAGKVVGGGSSINATYFVRGIPEDYDLWASQGNDLWSYQQLLPFLKSLETDLDFPDSEHHGKDGPLKVSRLPRKYWGPWQEAFYQAALENGFPETPDHNHPESTGISPVPSNNYGGIRQSSAIAFLNPARYRPNLNVKGDTLVRRILFEGRRAVGLEVESKGEVFKIGAGEIVISAGVYFSPAILQHSGIGPAEHLRSLDIPVVVDLPGVGKNLRDHPRVWVNWKIHPDFKSDHVDLAPMPTSLRYTATGSKLRNDIRIAMLKGSDSGEGQINQYPEPRFSMNVILYFQNGSGELKIASNDPHQQPEIDFQYFADEFDRMRMREAVRTAVKLSGSSSFKGMLGQRVEPTDEELANDDLLDVYLQRRSHTSGHVAGTCKMGPSTDPMAVVDQYGRVHGVSGLRVADASIMPHSVRANTNVTCLTIGARIADLMLHAR
jgi:choline dehydrogenase